jgi:HJR/Mrr/RecB family endonuclease
MNTIVFNRQLRERQISVAEETLQDLVNRRRSLTDKSQRHSNTVQKCIFVGGLIISVFAQSPVPFFLSIFIILILWMTASTNEGAEAGLLTKKIQEQGARLEEMRAAHAKAESEFAMRVHTHNDRVLKQVADQTRKLRKASDLHPNEFEDKVAALFQTQGYKVQQTPYVRDEGKDAILEKDGKKAYLECKRHDPSNPVGRPTLQRLKGAMSADNIEHGVLVTTGTFSEPARVFAQANGIKLCDGEWVLRNFMKAGYLMPKIEISHFSLMCGKCGESRNFTYSSESQEQTCECGAQVLAWIPKHNEKPKTKVKKLRTWNAYRRWR